MFGEIDSLFYFHFIVKKQWPKLLGEGRVYWLILPGHNPSLREVRSGTQNRNQEVEQLAISHSSYLHQGIHSKPRTYIRNRERYCLTHPLTGLASFLLQSRNTCLEITLPTLGWALPLSISKQDNPPTSCS